MADVTVHGAGKVAADLVALGIGTAARVHATVVAYGGLLETAVKTHANQPRTAVRPRGPNVEGPRHLTSPGFLGSIGRRITRDGTMSVAEVGSSAPQARRLEYGFKGQDSLGRTFNQVAYPSFGPGLDEIKPQFDAAIDVVLAEAIR